MVKVIGVKFRNSGRVYYFDPVDMDIQPGSGVIVETARGVEYGEVTMGVTEVEEDTVVSPLKAVQRVAADEDRRLLQLYRDKEKEAFDICQRKIEEHGLDMKLVNAEYTFNGSKVVFYFTADERVDFRELVKDLAYVFKTRIELRQIGVRDEAKMLGGLGPCGRPVCCKQFLDDFRPVSIKMAKEQNLSLSPTKISGLCGRLMCCLQYEESCYEQMHKLMPKTGKEIETPDGVGIAVENNVITEKTKVKLTAEDGTIDIREYPYQDLGPGARERALERAAQAMNEPEKEGAEGFTPLRQTNSLRQSRGRQPRRGEQAAQPKGEKTPSKGEKQPKGDNSPQNGNERPQPKGDGKPQPKGNKNQNRSKGSKENKPPKAEAPAVKAESEPKAEPSPAPAPEGTKAVVPFSRKHRSNNRRRSFGPRTPTAPGGGQQG